MTGDWYILLADNGEGLEGYTGLIVLLILGLLSWVFRKVKAKQAADNAGNDAGPAGRPAEGGQRPDQGARPGASAGREQPAAPGRPAERQPTPAAQALRALREVLEGRGEPPAPPRQEQPQPRRAAPRRAAPATPPAARRSPAPARRGTLASDLGEGVLGGVSEREQELRAEEAARKRRLKAMQQLQVSIGAASAGPQQIADQTAIVVDLGGRDELVRAIVYSEILGRPKALRTSRESWDL